jgi:TonB family protein
MKTPALLVIAFAFASVVRAGEVSSAADYVPCRVVQKTPGHFPIRLLQQGVKQGEASIVLEIGPDGKITDQLVTSFTHPEFGKEAARIVREWTFAPGLLKGRPIISVATIDFEFTVNGMSVYERHPDTLRMDDYFAKKYAYFPHGLDSLDARPTARATAAPVYPEAWIAQGHRGSVTVRFYIDETGKPRMPVASEGADPLLAASAIAAVQKWQFAPPTAHGTPTLAYAEQVFSFEPALTDSR